MKTGISITNSSSNFEYKRVLSTHVHGARAGYLKITSLSMTENRHVILEQDDFLIPDIPPLLAPALFTAATLLIAAFIRGKRSMHASRNEKTTQ
jgi:hypothetical protein